MTLNQRTERIYLDHSATTPVEPEVVEAMLPFLAEHYGNASSIHSFGQEAKVALEDARRQIASLLSARPAEIVFTCGGTEANNWAIKGAAAFHQGRKNHIVTSAAEHHAVLFTCQYLQKQGVDVTYVPVDETGMVDPQQVADAIRDDTFLISIMHANNEVGTINPIREFGQIAHENSLLFHTDAVQTFGKMPVDVNAMHIDLLSLSGHKIYAPKGIGALYVRQGIQLDKLMHGGKHEHDRRAGTENVPAAVGLGKAAEICSQRMEDDLGKLQQLRDALQQRILEQWHNVHLNGHLKKRLPGILNVSFEGAASDSLLLSLDLKGIAVSNGSACTSGSVEPSHVLQAMGLPGTLANSALRFSFGRQNKPEEIDFVIDALDEILARLRRK